ncbi:Gfo/Idh/MocA family oxidoreductase [Edaphobacter sp. HDX4]|uniref:Gfo/Idh/MocA family protein n=1 Tax=Edaphobacter sp. HDX4 TaxID=2794064 RepID=UPI002FE545D3
MNQTHTLSRRQVLAGAAALGGLGAMRSLGISKGASSLEKANIAFIGIGNYGATNLRELASENIVAVCDVDWRTRAQLPGRFTPAVEVAAAHPGAKRFDDWRVMLDQMDKQIDAVVVCTADHVHAQAALTAMKMGKHVYCEKPLAATIEEVRAMAHAAQHSPRQATQTGIVGHASEDVRLIVEWIRAGAIGTVDRIDVFQTDWASGKRYINPYSDVEEVNADVPVPQEVKWDFFLGPAPVRKYNPMYLPLRWRNWQDFGTGILGDHGPHFLDPVVWALDLGYPESVEADADAEYSAEIRKQMFARVSHVSYRFSAKGSRPPVSVKWWGYDTPPTPPGWKKGEPLPTGGGIVYGTKGVLVYGPVYSSKPGEQKQVWLLPEELDRSFERPAKSVERPSSHWMEWIDAAKRGTQPSCSWAYGAHITELCLLGNIAIAHHGTVLRFDAEQKRFSNSESANAMFTRPRRKGWKLPV